ncbi:MAG: toxin-antitoxin system HicB family antitoxin [Deltaproteobacteria bacterium]|nr:toxin-antitoxin system HicB family antitoxin [Deltaproteobacteria bacterium]
MRRGAPEPEGAPHTFTHLTAHRVARAVDPIAGKRFSGKFMVRVPPDVHRQLAIQAAEAGVSLNRLASAKLSQ